MGGTPLSLDGKIMEHPENPIQKIGWEQSGYPLWRNGNHHNWSSGNLKREFELWKTDLEQAPFFSPQERCELTINPCGLDDPGKSDDDLLAAVKKQGFVWRIQKQLGVIEHMKSPYKSTHNLIVLFHQHILIWELQCFCAQILEVCRACCQDNMGCNWVHRYIDQWQRFDGVFTHKKREV